MASGGCLSITAGDSARIGSREARIVHRGRSRFQRGGEATMEPGKRALVFSLTGLIFLLAGSFIAVDWVVFLFGVETIYPGVAKPVTSWFITEIVGKTYNVQLGLISDLALNFVWIFYGTTIVCLALSGYSWIPRRSSASEAG
jgi:hypothetical protein